MRVLTRPASLLLAACLVVGAALVGWRAYARCRLAHALARAEVQARAAALEVQFAQAPAAAEALGALARQSRGVLTDFQRVAKELRNRFPALNTVELQPGGVVSEVVPRERNERALGLAVLRDAGQGPGANEALKQRALTVSGPVRLYHGEYGIVARVPVFQRAANGQESFWGFVAATMRLQDALAYTQVNQLPRCGYDYALFVPATGRQKGQTLISSSRYALRQVEQETVPVPGVKLQLAVAPRAGWVDVSALVTESLVVLLFSALAFLVASALANRRASDGEFAQMTERLNQEQAKRTEAEAAHRETKDQMATLQTELKGAQLALQQAGDQAMQLEARLETSARERDEAAQLEQAKQQETQAALAKAQETIAQLEQDNRQLKERLAQAEEAVVLASPNLPGSLAPAEEASSWEAAAEAAAPLPEVPATDSPAEPAPDPVVETPVEAEPEAPAAVPEQATAASSAEPVAPQTAPESSEVTHADAPAPAQPAEAPVEPAPPKPASKPRRKKARDDQMNLFASEGSNAPANGKASPKPTERALDPKAGQPGETPAQAARLPAPPPVEAAELRKAVHLIVPLLVDQDPGAKDCLRDNRTTFRSAFAPEAYVEFEQAVKRGDFAPALEDLKKAARKHGISV